MMSRAVAPHGRGLRESLIVDRVALALPELLGPLGDPDSGVGAGSAAAVVGAIASGALQGVARASAGAWPEAPGAAAQAEALAARLLRLAEENAESYRRARAGLAGAIPGDLQERRDFALRLLLQRSAEVPEGIASATADVAELAEGVARSGLDARRPDACAAATLAAAASDAAAMLVAVNLAEGEEGSLARRARESASRARERQMRAATRLRVTGITSPSAPDDAGLVRRCLAGEEAAWSELVDRYNRYVYAICIRAYRLPEHDAEDVFQEAFARVFTSTSAA